MRLDEAVHRLRTRIRVNGFWRTIGYVLFTVFLERFHVSIDYVFEGLPDQTAKLSGECSPAAVTSMAELSTSTVEALRRYGGERFLGGFERAFSRGEVCIVAYLPDHSFAGAVWLKGADRRYLPAKGRDYMRFESGFTLPECRGRGALSSVLAFGRSWLYSSTATAPLLFLECSVFNTSSKRGILRAGFQERGVLLLMGKKWGKFFPRGAATIAPKP